MPLITVHGIPNEEHWEDFKHVVGYRLVQAVIEIRQLGFCAADFVVEYPPPLREEYQGPAPTKIIILVEHLFERPDTSKQREKMVKHVAKKLVAVVIRSNTAPTICIVRAPHPYDIFHSSYDSFRLLGE